MNAHLNTLEAIRSAKEALELVLQSQPMAQAALELLEKEESVLLDENPPAKKKSLREASKRPQKASRNKKAA